MATASTVVVLPDETRNRLGGIRDALRVVDADTRTSLLRMVPAGQLNATPSQMNWSQWEQWSQWSQAV
jgi:hypothetical protein